MFVGPQKILSWLQTILWVAVGIAFLQGRGAHGTFIAVAGAIPLLRLLFSRSYRSQVLARYRGAWSEIEAFSADPSRAIPWRAGFWWMGLGVLVLTLANGSLHSSNDNRGTVLTSISIARSATPDFSAYVDPDPNSTARERCGVLESYFAYCTGKGVYSSYPPGMLLFTVPVFTTARFLGADLDGIKSQQRLEKLTAVLSATFCCVLFFAVALSLVGARPAWIAALFFSFGSAIFSTSAGGVWTNGGVAFWTVVILAIECLGRKRLLLQSIAFSAMLACRLTSVAVSAPIGAWILVRDVRRGIVTVLCSGMFFLPWAIYHYLLYAQPLGPQMLQGTGFRQGLLSQLGFVEKLLSVLFSPARGFFIYQPWLLLAIPAFLFLPRTRGPKGLAVTCLIGFALQTLVISSWGDWAGGWGWGSRLMTEAVPLLAIVSLPAFVWLDGRRWGRIGLGALFAVSFYLHFAHFYLGANKWMAAKPAEMSWQARYWQWTDPPFLFPFHRP